MNMSGLDELMAADENIAPSVGACSSKNIFSSVKLISKSGNVMISTPVSRFPSIQALKAISAVGVSCGLSAREKVSKKLVPGARVVKR